MLSSLVRAAAVLCMCASAVSAEQPSPTDLLAQFEKSLEARRTFSFRARRVVSLEGPNGQVIVQSGGGTFRRADERYDVSFRPDTWPGGFAFDQFRGQVSRILVSADIAILFDVVGTMAPALLAQIPDIAEGRGRARAVLGNAVSVDLGYLAEDKGTGIVEILRTASDIKLRPAQEVIDGAATWVLEADSDYGEYRLWIDPAAGYSARRVQVIKSQGNRTSGGRRAGTTGEPPQRDQGDELATATLYMVTVEHTGLTNHGPAWIPEHTSVTTEIEREDGSHVRYSDSLTRYNVDLSAKSVHAGEFLPRALDGTPVEILGPAARSGVQYEWRGGKIVPYVSPEAARQLDRDIAGLEGSEPRSDRGPSAGRLWVGVLCAVLACIVVFAVVVMYRRRGDARSLG